MKRKWPLTMLGAVIAAWMLPAPPPVLAGEAVSFLGNLSRSDLQLGCGCYLKRAEATGEEDPFVFVSELVKPPDRERTAWIHVETKDVPLALVHATPRVRKRGQRFTEIYAAGDLSVLVRYVVSRAPVYSSKVTAFNAQVTATRGGDVATIDAAGHCGC